MDVCLSLSGPFMEPLSKVLRSSLSTKLAVRKQSPMVILHLPREVCLGYILCGGALFLCSGFRYLGPAPKDHAMRFAAR